MDLGLDYCRVLLALGFVSSWVLHTKIGMAGRGHWGKPRVSRQAFSGFYKNGPDQSDTPRIVYLVRLISIWYCIANAGHA